MKKSHLFGYCVFLSVGFSAMQFNSCSTTKKAKPCSDCPSFTLELTTETDTSLNSLSVDSLIYAMIEVESRGDDSAYCASEEAVGCLQIRPIMVKEINRVSRRLGLKKTYTLHDRWSRPKSIQMLKIFARFYHLNDFEDIARCWNGGPRGMTYATTKGYWNKVQNEMI